MIARRPRATPSLRDTVLFLVGLAGIIVETVYSVRFHETPDYPLLVLFGSMIGLPAYLSLDTKGSDDDDDRAPRRRDDGEPPTPTSSHRHRED